MYVFKNVTYLQNYLIQRILADAQRIRSVATKLKPLRFSTVNLDQSRPNIQRKQKNNKQSIVNYGTSIAVVAES